MNPKNWMLRHAAACCGMLPNPCVQLQKAGAAACCGMLRLHMCVIVGRECSTTCSTCSHKKERKACQEPSTAPGAVHKRSVGEVCRGTFCAGESPPPPPCSRLLSRPPQQQHTLPRRSVASFELTARASLIAVAPPSPISLPGGSAARDGGARAGVGVGGGRTWEGEGGVRLLWGRLPMDYTRITGGACNANPTILHNEVRHTFQTTSSAHF